MLGKFHHEHLFRGPELIEKLSRTRITVCGAGALGSHLVDNLARQGLRHLRVIDHDRVEEHNISTQLYGESDVGGWKVDVLRNLLFRSVGVEVEAVRKELTAGNAQRLLSASDLVIDAFDNAASRGCVQVAVRAGKTACLHIGLNADYGEAIWDLGYRVPRGVGVDGCDHPLARNLIQLTVAVASELIVRAIGSQCYQNRSITLADFAIREVGGE